MATDIEQDTLSAQRRRKAAELRDLGFDPYANDFRVNTRVAQFYQQYGAIQDREALEQVGGKHALAGRVMAVNTFGKAAFLRIQDGTADATAIAAAPNAQEEGRAEAAGRLQLFLRKEQVGDETFEVFKKQLDIGDIIGVVGTPMRTKTGELTLNVHEFRILTKSLRPLPEKWHGLSDLEIRYRQRYLDLTVNADSRRVFLIRSRIISYLRRFFERREFIEVETPMMQSLAGGAAARPFKTHHNALDMPLYLRIAPELYLKRLLVGGFERVYEINRNFRNEGISTMHNPEFTMLEFYQAYATYEDLMDIGEAILAGAAEEVIGRTEVVWNGHEISLKAPFARMSMLQAIAAHGGPSPEDAVNPEVAAAVLQNVGIDPKDMGAGHMMVALFEHFAESKLIAPTFVYDYPAAVSPLSRLKPSNPEFVDRFELFVGGKELANAFSELNDPDDQRGRFEAQMQAKAAGDEEAHAFDEDYVRALEYGMPPAGGFGLGIDRLVMLLAEQSSIRDVILFPLMRPER